jgi:hypothetical protein
MKKWENLLYSTHKKVYLICLNIFKYADKNKVNIIPLS